jgi:UDP-N-acetylglucosamine--N-acetylmuramyl-(pentapeptide) pyrophosphoryl-undecaprenol N-acetylglucosamine transferase
MSTGNTIGICGGGTGGHIYPALAVIQELQRLAPEIRLCYFGRERGMEREIITRAGIPFQGLALSGLARSLTLKNIKTVWQAGRGWKKARGYLRQSQVKSILGTGGYVCGPVMLAAASLGIPSMIHESNYIPGLTNRLLGRWVTHVGVSHTQTGKYFPKQKVTVMGFPLRDDLLLPTREEGCQALGLDPQKRVLFVFSGSQAARKINRAVAEMLPQLSKRIENVQLLWMTGETDFKMAQQVCEKVAIKSVVREFIYDVPNAYAAADLVVARAGAGTIAELSATGCPALLIPYPFATGNHQAHNAAVLQKFGSAEVVEDSALDKDTLLTRLEKLFKRLKYMRECGAVLQADYPKEAAQILAQKLIEMAGK